MVEIKLRFDEFSKKEFDEFLLHQFTKGGSTWHRDQVLVSNAKNGGSSYTITATADEIYMLGYEWALWQFPPNK